MLLDAYSVGEAAGNKTGIKLFMNACDGATRAAEWDL